MSEKVKEEGSFKVKKKPGRPKKLTNKGETIKVDLSKKEEKVEDAVQEQTTDEVLVRDEPKASEEVSKENIEETTEKPAKESKEEKVIPIQEKLLKNPRQKKRKSQLWKLLQNLLNQKLTYLKM